MFTFIEVMDGNFNNISVALSVLADTIFIWSLHYHYKAKQKIPEDNKK